MTESIFIVEGLPGVGKSFFCEVLQREIRRKLGSRRIHYFEERDEGHPFHCASSDIGSDIWSTDYRDCMGIVEDKCRAFFGGRYRDDEIYIFDCGLLQRPLFHSMIISGLSEQATCSHLLKMHENYAGFPHRIFYLKSGNYVDDFESIYESRGSDYRDHIERAWNGGAYGTGNRLKGLAGAVEVLKYFKELKERFADRLDLSPAIIDNTVKEPRAVRDAVRGLL